MPVDARLEQVAEAAEAEERRVGQRRDRCVRRRLLTGFSVGDVQLAVGEHTGAIAMIEPIAERPRHARLGIVRARVGAAERREAIVADAEVQHQLIEQTDFCLREIGFDVTQRPVFLNAGRDRVLDVVRGRRDQLLAEREGLTQPTRVKVLTDREREVGVGAERVPRRRDQVVVDLEVVEVVARNVSNCVAT